MKSAEQQVREAAAVLKAMRDDLPAGMRQEFDEWIECLRDELHNQYARGGIGPLWTGYGEWINGACADHGLPPMYFPNTDEI